MIDNWIYNGTPLDGTEDFIQGFRSFVYCITNLQDGRKYYGKKRLQFTSHKRKRGRVRRIKVVKESDWRTYWGSNDQLKSDVERFGSHCFSREILRFCRTLSESSYYELREQMTNDVLFHPERYYNAYVGARISRRQLGVKDA